MFPLGFHPLRSAPISHTGTHATQSSVASDSATPSTHSGVHDSSLASSTGAHATDANSATGAANGTAEPEPKYKSGEGPAVGIPPSVTAKAGGPGTSTTAAGSSAGGEVGADGYPEQRHGGSVGLGPNYAKHPTMGDKVGGAMEEIKGKMLKKPEVAQHGHDRKTGELYEKLAKEDDANDVSLVECPFPCSSLELIPLDARCSPSPNLRTRSSPRLARATPKTRERWVRATTRKPTPL